MAQVIGIPCDGLRPQADDVAGSRAPHAERRFVFELVATRRAAPLVRLVGVLPRSRCERPGSLVDFPVEDSGELLRGNAGSKIALVDGFEIAELIELVVDLHR